MQIKKNNLCVFRKLSWRSIIIHLTSEHLLYMEQLITRSTLQLQLIFELIISSSIASIDNHTYNIQFRIALIIYYRLFKNQLMVENIYIYIYLTYHYTKFITCKCNISLLCNNSQITRNIDYNKLNMFLFLYQLIT